MKKRYFKTTFSLYRLIHVVAIILCISAFFSVYGCSDSSPTPTGGSGDEGGDDEGGGNSGGVIWDGTVASNWIETVEVSNDSVYLVNGIFRSKPLNVQSISTANLYLGFLFDGETSLHTIAIEVSGYGNTASGGQAWTMLNVGDQMYTEPASSVVHEVYNSSWELFDGPIDSIKVKFTTFNEASRTILVNPRVES